MRLRRSSEQAAILSLPLDGVDMFLLSQLDAELSIEQLLDVSPCDVHEMSRRLSRLARLGLVVITYQTRAGVLTLDLTEHAARDGLTTSREPRPGRAARPAPEGSATKPRDKRLLDDLVTMRPPTRTASQWTSAVLAARPPSHVAAEIAKSVASARRAVPQDKSAPLDDAITLRPAPGEKHNPRWRR